MALHIKLYSNGDHFQTFTATRITRKTHGWNTYEISEWYDGSGCILGTIRHKYEDGAAVLSRKVLQFATKKVK